MYWIKLSVRPAALAAVLAMTALTLWSASPSPTSAAGPFTFTGVTCIEVAQGAFPRSSLIMSRIEPSGPDFAVTSVGYEGDTDNNGAADVNAGPDCSELDDNNSLTAGVDPDAPNVKNRPGATATVVTKGAGAESGTQCAVNNAVDDDSDFAVNDGCPAVGLPEAGAQCANATDDDADGGNVNDGCPTVGPVTNLEWEEDCQFRGDISLWVATRFKINITGQKTLDPAADDPGTLGVWLGASDAVCAFPGTPSLSLAITSRVRTSAPAKGAPAAGPDDWDGDGHTDWRELLPLVDIRCDPMNANDGLPTACGPGAGVGGVAELPEAALNPAETSGQSSGGAGLVAAIAGATAGALALGGAGWYARRRWSR